MKKLIFSFLPIFVVILLSLPTVFPLFRTGFFPMHDNTQVARVYEMAKSIKDGMFPVRWVSDLGYGYGYPIFNFYAPLAYYFGSLFILFGLNALLAAKIMFITGILTAGISMYFLGKEFWRTSGGIISGIFYQYATYHAVDIYVRGDVAEFWAYGLLPFVFLSFYKIYKNDPSTRYRSVGMTLFKWIVLGGLSYAALILSHNLTAMMVTPFLIIFILVLVILSKNKLYALRATLYAIALGILLSAFYWLPALAEMKFTNILSQIGGGADYKDHFVCLEQFWYSAWGYGGSAPECVTGMSLMIGKMHIIFVFISFAIVLFYLVIPMKMGIYINNFLDSRLRGNDKFKVIMLLALAGFIISLFLQTSASLFIWQHVPFMPYFQYPWRFLILTSFFSSLLAGGVIYFFYLKKEMLSAGVSIIILISIIALQSKFFVPQKIILVSSDNFTNSFQLQWLTSRISDEYLPSKFKIPKDPSGIVQNEKIIGKAYISVVKMIENKTQRIRFSINSPVAQTILLRIAPFPAWRAYINDSREQMRASNIGYILMIQAGEQSVIVKYEETPIELAANIISLFGLFLFIPGIIYFYLIKRNL